MPEVINSLLKVVLGGPQNFLQKHVYNLLVFVSSSLGVLARKLCLLCSWWFAVLIRRPAMVRAGICLVVKQGLNVSCLEDEHLKD